MYLTHNEGTSVVAERFNRTFKKNKIYEYRTFAKDYVLNCSEEVFCY